MIVELNKILSVLEVLPPRDRFFKDEKLGLTSVPGDPIHPGHCSCLRECKKYCDVLIVAVNDDQFLLNKKGFVFQPLEDRVRIIDSIKGVDFTIPFHPSNPNDMTVTEALSIIKPDVFLKGGDRKADSSLPEWNVCVENNIKIIDGIGASKMWSSSDYLKKYKEFVLGCRVGSK